MPIERLPMKVQPAAYRVRAFLMTDSTVLLILGGVLIATGLYYSPVLGAPLPWRRPIEAILPLGMWVWVHLGAGVLCWVAAFTQRLRVDVLALSFSTALNLAWGFSLLFASISHEQSVLWLVAVLLAALTMTVIWAVWRGKRGDIPLAEDEKGRGA